MEQNQKNQTILVTGGAGYIGSHTVLELIKAGYRPVIVDDFSNSDPAVLKRLEQLAGEAIACYRINLCQKDKLREAFVAEKPTAVIHFAGLKAVGESVEKPLEYYRNNLDSTLSVLELMRETGCHQLIFSSSATVYGRDGQVPFVETAPTSATNPYGWTKYMIEQILRDVCEADPNLSAVSLRYFNPVGAHPSGKIGENPLGRPNNLMPVVTQVAVGKLDRLKVFGDDYETPDGTGVRDYIHVVDLALGHVAALRYADEHKGMRAINLGSGVGHSVLELVNTFSQVNQVAVPYDIVGRRPGDIAFCYADPSLAKELLGWETERSLEEMCRDSWHWQKSNPNGYEG